MDGLATWPIRPSAMHARLVVGRTKAEAQCLSAKHAELDMPPMCGPTMEQIRSRITAAPDVKQVGECELISCARYLLGRMCLDDRDGFLAREHVHDFCAERVQLHSLGHFASKIGQSECEPCARGKSSR